ncbi:MAG: histidine--tRNA ligase [Candidatus Omnitrophota bacterium]|nr:histidine--tRNA ligase [Candidatus Omnitrophota bacterium]
MFKKTPGTKDILPDEVSSWQTIEETTRNIFSFYNYKEIRPPIIEEAALFNRSLGESAEIVQKQMFLVKKDKDVYALRPEGTASIVRAYLENNLDKTAGLIKVYYIGPMFRAERPQKGRLRQFHHLGCEVIGSQVPYLDAEIISLADNLLKAYTIEGYEIKINSLGCTKDKKEFTEVLRKSLKDKIPKLCDDCKVRFKTNVLRILDCKNEGCIEVVKKLDIRQNHLCPECKGHFDKVKEGLDSLNIDYKVNPYLVRGLDYYTRTVFEIIHGDLGAQNALGAGGRYDNLVHDLGGPSTGAIGFAFGIERLLLVASREYRVESKKLVYIITLGEDAKKEGLKLLNNLRRAGITSDTDYEDKSLKGALRRANDLSARLVLIIGEDELKKGAVALKDMVSGEQKEVKQEDLIKSLKLIVTGQ